MNSFFSAPLVGQFKKMRAAKRPLALRRRICALETLESRAMMAADFRTFDGTGNNLLNSEWGSTAEQLLRKSAAAYTDGASTPAGATRASARAISNIVVAHPEEDLINERGLSAFIYVWGQFLDHDLGLTSSASPAEAFNVVVPTGDPEFDPTGTGTQTIRLSRSLFDTATGTTANNPRQQVNRLTAFVDGSQIYGSDAERAAALRTLEGGHLKTSAGDLLPFNEEGLENTVPPGPANTFFLAGDVRANENIELTAIHTLFLREHNRVADALALEHPTWDDERLYQEARKWVGAELQAITYNEFLPALLGENALKEYRGYNAKINPGIANEFSTAAFRLGHSFLGDDIEFLDNNGEEVHEEVALRDAFSNPGLLIETGIDSILKYLATDRAEELDVHIVDDVRNFLFGQPGAGGLDLASLNIQRGRDHGIADFNSVRVAYGLKPVRSFADITSDKETQVALKVAYGSVNNIDLWVGGLSEDHVRGSSLGPLFQRILVDQFQRLRDGDRFWYERIFRGSDLRELRNTTLAEIVSRNTTTTNLQENVFFFNPSISGRVTIDAGRRTQAVQGVTVQLLDDEGEIVATTCTDRQWRYEFDTLDIGTFHVQIVLPAGYRQATENPAPISITTGDAFDDFDFGLLKTLLPGWNPFDPRPRR